MTEADYADDLVLLPNTPVHTEFLPQAAGGIGFYVSASKTECICFKQKGTIFPLRGKISK